MNKILNIAAWVGGLGLIIILLAFSNDCRSHIKIQSTDIEIDYSNKQYFINPGEVEQIVREEYPYLDSLFCKEININLLEERLDNHPSIRKAEVYSALDGILRIRVKQKRPVFRVQNSKRSYYIDETGDSMPLSPNFSARVPLVTGQISAETEAKIFDFFEQLEDDTYFSEFFNGVHVESDGEWVLFPEPGRHKVIVGQPEDLKEKMEKLRIFYERVVDTKNLDSIEALNLAYDKQVVCTKY